MTKGQALFPPVLRSLFFVAMTASMMWSSSTPASAQATVMVTTVTRTAVPVTITGTVRGLPESVSFRGLAQFNANVVTDPDFGATPTVVLSIDLGKVTGVGLSTGKRYITASQEILNRRLSAADTVQFTFPFFASGGSAISPSVGMASFHMSFNVNTMSLVAVTANITSP